MQEPRVTFSIPRSIARIALEGSPGPHVELALIRAKVTRKGRGYRYAVTCSRQTAIDLRDYLESVAGVVGDMTSAERDGTNEAPDARRGVAILDAALS